MITERDDVHWALVVPDNQNGDGVGYVVGFDGVTQIKVVKRHGPMDWLPYIEVWQGDHLHAEIAQFHCLTVEFKAATTAEQGGPAS